jgi:sugar phosphate isomerase/epimerase
MRFGINSFLFTSPFTTASVGLFKTFKKWGFDTVEIPIEDPSHLDPVAVKAAADKAGIAIGSVCAAMGPGRDFRGSDEEQATAMAYCKAIIDQAADHGLPALIGPVYSVVGKADAVEPGPAESRMGSRGEEPQGPRRPRRGQGRDDLHRAAQPLRDRLPQHLRPGPEADQGRQARPR